MTQPLSVNPPRTPLLDTGGNVTKEWWRFFFSLNRKTAQAAAGEVSTLPGSGLEGGGSVADGIDLSIAPNGVENGMIRQSLATSVIGRFQGADGNVADIQATADNRVLGRFGGILAFKDVTLIPATVADGDYGDISVTLSGATWTIDANVVSNTKFRQSGALSVVGRAGNTTGNVADITGAASQFFGVNAAGTTLGFQTLAGDATLSGPTLTLATVNANTGAWGSATQAPVITLDAKGRATAASNVTITPAASSITGGQALTKTDDTNVTLTLGGTPATALLVAASITVGWSGTLSVARGGLGVGTITGLLQGNGTSAVTAISNSSTVGQVLRVTGAVTYGWGAIDLANASAITGTLPIGNAPTGTSGATLPRNDTANTFSGALTINPAGSPTAPQLILDGTTSNRIQWNTQGTAAPAFTTRSAGAKLVLYPAIDGSHADYAFGVEASYLWTGVPTAAEGFKWYGGTTLAATLTGGGALTLVGTLAASNYSGTSSGTNTGDQTTISGNAGSATILQTGRTIAITGDLAWTSPSFNGSANVTAAGTLATVNANVGSFGSATQAGTFTVNAKGLVTAAANVTITPAVGSVTGLGTGVATALAVNVGSAGAFVTFNGALGTPSSGTLTSATGLPISTGVSGLGTGVATFLATPSSANLRAALTDETGTGNAVFATNPTLVGAALTDQLSSTMAGSTVNPQVYLNGATNNWIGWNTQGFAAPAFTTRSAGAKLVLYPTIDATHADYAIGIEGGFLWFNVPTAAEGFKWYGGTTLYALLDPNGLAVTGKVTATTYLKSTAKTVATLAVAAIAGAGARDCVTDALGPAFGAAVVGGGAVVIPVFSDGVVWKVG